MAPDDTFNIGVEEEYFLIDPITRALSPDIERVLPQTRHYSRGGNQVEAELHRCQIEVGTDVCSSLSEVRRQLQELRYEVAASARASGKVIGASSTHPLSDSRASNITPTPDYLRLERDYAQLAREQVICGCHVHIGMPGREQTIGILNRARAWLWPILALSVNSPFWAGVDTGYDSYRTGNWARWPTAGTPHELASWEEYEDVLASLQETGSIDKPGRLYWDLRPSAKFDTLEFRATDVCLTVDEAVMVTGLLRALARTCHRMLVDGTAQRSPRPELLGAAKWRAARYGINGDLVDVVGRRSLPAREMIAEMVDFLGPALDESGERQEVERAVQATLEGGTGADRQRRAFQRAGRLEDVVDYIVWQTCAT